MSCCDGVAIHELYHHPLDLGAMYHLLSGLHSYLTRKDEYSVVIIGLDNVRDSSARALVLADNGRQGRRYVHLRAPVTESCARGRQAQTAGTPPTSSGVRRRDLRRHGGGVLPGAVRPGTRSPGPQPGHPHSVGVGHVDTGGQPHAIVTEIQGVQAGRDQGILRCPGREALSTSPDSRQCWRRSRPSTTRHRAWLRTRLRQR